MGGRADRMQGTCSRACQGCNSDLHHLPLPWGASALLVLKVEVIHSSKAQSMPMFWQRQYHIVVLHQLHSRTQLLLPNLHRKTQSLPPAHLVLHVL